MVKSQLQLARNSVCFLALLLVSCVLTKSFLHISDSRFVEKSGSHSYHYEESELELIISCRKITSGRVSIQLTIENSKTKSVLYFPNRLRVKSAGRLLTTVCKHDYKEIDCEKPAHIRPHSIQTFTFEAHSFDGPKITDSILLDIGCLSDTSKSDSICIENVLIIHNQTN